MTRRRKGEHGAALMEFLDAEFEAMGIPWSRWARDHDIQPTKLARWRDGVDPDLTGLVEVAAALGRSPVDLIIEAGYADATDFGVVVQITPPPDIDDAINRSPGLTELERNVLRVARESARDMANGARRSVRRLAR